MTEISKWLSEDLTLGLFCKSYTMEYYAASPRLGQYLETLSVSTPSKSCFCSDISELWCAQLVIANRKFLRKYAMPTSGRKMQSQESRSCPQMDLGSAELLIFVVSIAKLGDRKRGFQEIEEADTKVGRRKYTGWITTMEPLAEGSQGRYLGEQAYLTGSLFSSYTLVLLCK